MLTVCRRYTRHQLEAEDILQDAFIKVFDKIDQFKFNGSFEGWIRRIVVNEALMFLRKRQKITVEIEEYHVGIPTGGTIEEGFSHKEIAESLKIQEATSRSQLLKARKMLQVQILKLQKISA